jgi:hypothetical protein
LTDALPRNSARAATTTSPTAAARRRVEQRSHPHLLKRGRVDVHDRQPPDLEADLGTARILVQIRHQHVAVLVADRAPTVLELALVYAAELEGDQAVRLGDVGEM